MTDWNALRLEYVTSGLSYRALAEKYGVSYRGLRSRGGAEGWPDLRRAHRDRLLREAMDSDARRYAERMERIRSVSDRLLEKLEKAVEELELQSVVQRIREDRDGVLVTQERREAAQTGMVDRPGLKQISSALRDIKEVQMLCSELDRQEQQARIAMLERQAREQPEDQTLTVVLEGDVEAYAQ